MIRKALLLVLKFFIAIGLFAGIQQLVELKTRGFCLQKIQADDLPWQASFEIPPLSLEEEGHVQQLLSQNFHMIGAGSECFAYLSDDRETVIKFFKLDHVRPVYLHRGLLQEDHSALAGTLSDHPLTKVSLPEPLQHWLKKVLGIREYRLQRTLGSIRVAWDDLREETGLLYLHLNPTHHLQRRLSLYDSCGIRHEIDLDRAKFFLQKRATPTEQHFATLKKSGDHQSARESIDALIAMILGRCKKGFYDRDILNRNLGFIGTRVIEIDAGSFIKSPRMKEPSAYKRELFFATRELKHWLEKNDPPMARYLEDRVTEEIRRDT